MLRRTCRRLINVKGAICDELHADMPRYLSAAGDYHWYILRVPGMEQKHESTPTPKPEFYR
eukprot:gene38345-13073_t